ncbi:MAG: tRNA (adenosine(37)-N6)-threonylcarbamoyltransferase complex ATPase subunit type 1 TsaE [Bacteroidia bacterium]
MELELEYSLETIPVIAREILAFAGDTKVILFNGQMGAGKTTLIKELCKSLGSVDNFSSPTFSLVNEYNSPSRKIFHLDLYRLKDLDELLDLGFEDIVQPGNYVFIEWPELAEAYLVNDFVKISIKTDGNIRYLHAAKF